MSRVAAVKRVLVGLPKSSRALEHTLLPKAIALPVFASDPLSSNAYATQEILLVLALAGNAALSLVVPIAMAVAMLLAIVVISYRQTVRAYPNGGGAFRVSYENLGMAPGLLAASALLTDYVMTVAVSIVAGSTPSSPRRRGGSSNGRSRSRFSSFCLLRSQTCGASRSPARCSRFPPTGSCFPSSR